MTNYNQNCVNRFETLVLLIVHARLPPRTCLLKRVIARLDSRSLHSGHCLHMVGPPEMTEGDIAVSILNEAFS